MSDEIIIDDEIKSDSFSISINSIILLYKPSTIVALNKLLDNNGYFGRYKIRKKVSRRLGETIINIEVYLPNSRTSYLWPFRTLYNMTIGALVKKVRLKKTPALIYIMHQLACYHSKIESIDSLPDKLMKDNMSFDRDYYQYMVTTLLHAGLITENKNKILLYKLKTEEDIEEVHSNLFITSNYLD